MASSDEKNAPSTRTVGTKVRPIFGDNLIASAGALRAMAAGIDAGITLEIVVVDGVAHVFRYDENTGKNSVISDE
jgi:hypothetical protein